MTLAIIVWLGMATSSMQKKVSAHCDNVWVALSGLPLMNKEKGLQLSVVTLIAFSDMTS